MAKAVVRVQKLTELAVLPTRGSKLAAGLDLASAYDAVIPAGGHGMVKTDLAIGIPDGCYARVAPRSGLALKKAIDTGAGVIDADYRGNIGVILFNHSTEDFTIKRGDRVAQLILEKIEYPEIQEVRELEATERGAGGYGSTGVDRPLKRAREPEDAVEGGSDADAVVNALETLAAAGAIKDDRRKLVKTRAFGASERQYGLLCTAMRKFERDGDEASAVEWIEAFLKATQ